jgi:hypothetical protein
MADREFLEAVSLEPGRRPFVEARDRLRFGLTQFSLQELAEEVMAAVPAAYPVKGDEQQVRRGERLEEFL